MTIFQYLHAHGIPLVDTDSKHWQKNLENFATYGRLHEEVLTLLRNWNFTQAQIEKFAPVQNPSLLGLPTPVDTSTPFDEVSTPTTTSPKTKSKHRWTLAEINDLVIFMNDKPSISELESKFPTRPINGIIAKTRELGAYYRGDRLIAINIAKQDKALDKLQK